MIAIFSISHRATASKVSAYLRRYATRKGAGETWFACADEPDGVVRVELRMWRTIHADIAGVKKHLDRRYHVEDRGCARLPVIEPHFGSIDVDHEDGHVLWVSNRIRSRRRG